jgi:plastocyanin
VRLSPGQTAVAAAAVIAAVAAAAPAFAGAGERRQAAPKPKLVQVRDYYYAPEVVRVRKGGRVKWSWGAGPTDAHDVALYKRPRGVRKARFRSEVASAPFTFARTFRRPGRYRFWCSLHPTQMRMQVRVRR